MLLQEYLDNPMGSGDSSIPNRKLIKANLDQKYNDLMSRKKIQYHIYRDSKTSFLIHMVIPSETERDNTYDVVFRFIPESKDIYNQTSIRNYDVQVFSNSPSFAYTFANVYDKHDMLVPSLKSKFEKIIFKKDPVVRNRYNIINYEKYVYFGAKYIIESKILLSKEYLIGNSKIYIPKKFLTDIRDVDTILVEYQRAEKKIRDAKRGTPTQNIGKIKDTGSRIKQPSQGTIKKVPTTKAKQPKKPRGTSSTIKKK